LVKIQIQTDTTSLLIFYIQGYAKGLGYSYLI